jgi:peroxiredoxin
LRDHYDEIREQGAEVVAIGTGNTDYAATFVRDERIPFRVYVDDDGAAARTAAVRSSSFVGLFHPRTWRASIETRRRGHTVHKAGARVTQLGATFVVGPGNVVRYEHLDTDSTDHAPLSEVGRYASEA